MALAGYVGTPVLQNGEDVSVYINGQRIVNLSR